MHKSRRNILITFSVLLIALTASVTAQDPNPEQAQLSAANNTFAFDLYSQIAQEDGNLFFSPYSISQAFAIAYAGANGNTEAEIASSFHFDSFPAPNESLHPIFSELTNQLNAVPAELSEEEAASVFQLSIVNALWLQTGFNFEADFLTLAENFYDADLETVDFVGNPAEAANQINAWVAENTQNRIKDIVTPDAFDALTRMLLTNAIYFKAAWASEFDPNLTQEAPFTLLDGGSVNAPFMAWSSGGVYLPYFVGDGYQALMLSYQSSSVGMVIILPDEGRFSEIEAALNAEVYGQMLAEMPNNYSRINLFFPKFEFDTSLGLGQPLTNLGLTTAFSPDQADFSGISNEADLYIANALHKAFIKVDEEGTEAAAVTALMFGTTSEPPPAMDLRVDRPFIFAIHDLETNSLLFLGRVLNPSE